jgi:hypothetical protein
MSEFDAYLPFLLPPETLPNIYYNKSGTDTGIRIPQIPGKIREVFSTGKKAERHSISVFNTGKKQSGMEYQYSIQRFFRAVSDAVSKYVSPFFENQIQFYFAAKIIF